MITVHNRCWLITSLTNRELWILIALTLLVDRICSFWLFSQKLLGHITKDLGADFTTPKPGSRMNEVEYEMIFMTLILNRGRSSSR